MSQDQSIRIRDIMKNIRIHIREYRFFCIFGTSLLDDRRFGSALSHSQHDEQWKQRKPIFI